MGVVCKIFGGAGASLPPGRHWLPELGIRVDRWPPHDLKPLSILFLGDLYV